MVDVDRIRPQFRRRGVLFKCDRDDNGVLMLFVRPHGRTPVCVFEAGARSGFRPASSFHSAPGQALDIVAATAGRRTIVGWLNERSCCRPRIQYLNFF